ncbi:MULTISPECIES: alpha/beta hydrolase [unclassified Methanoculleus]|uniref:alpha/beta fold hydrolase n=1 Tax=unclassified Methanoculleus TaxID=2619537 RepID=UPI0025EA1629|nr:MULTISPECIES: alpha/beta hydrolase [unclassified Methanoculleus]MCK9316809.1 alpha/beta hydrolase [Methanoculleus sp.]MDD2252730.1 alpha/beta hydrolase [Methanoculleus sp.]MDD2786453.1 alpha/beta hydrolase [Methanoculleus sp.]MDD3215287.1 alpha/beta hydrolase [Methanoculleus sp.]MDD4312973.1 alpha/beta hydrolase [Methanoculleus sp.]
METVAVDGVALEYDVSGSGEPAIFIHGALIADSFKPLMFEPALTRHYRLILYHRRGYAGSSHSGGPAGIVRQAADCRALLRHLGVERAHIVGHSSGACIAMQFALDAPDVVRSLALLEPALIVGSSGPAYRDSLLRGRERYRKEPPEQLVDEFLQARFGAGYRASLDRMVPGVFEQAVADAGTSFELEVPALLEWRFGEAEAKRITQPVLAVIGSGSTELGARFGETHRLLLEWFPDVRGFVLPGAAHGMQMQNARGMAWALADFWARHPLRSEEPLTRSRNS